MVPAKINKPGKELKEFSLIWNLDDFESYKFAKKAKKAIQSRRSQYSVFFRTVCFTLLIIFMIISLVYASQFMTNSQASFAEGTYTQTFYNITLKAVQLQASQIMGNYTSKVFDAGSISSWNTLSWSSNTGSILVAADVAEDVYKSIDLGLNWFIVNDSYNGLAVNAVEIGSTLNGTLYIVDLNENIWRSDNYGYTWINTKDDYNGAETNDATSMTITLSTGVLYIFEGDEDVWRSDDSGVTWSKVNDDFDGGGETANGVGSTSNSSGNVFVVANNADVYMSNDDGATWVEINADYNGGDANSATDMTSDFSNNLYILNNQDVWKSIDNGINWVKVNDDFNDADLGSGLTITSDLNNYLYITDGSEDIYKSTDSGTTWSLIISDLNGGSGNVLSITSFNQSVVKFQARSDDDNENWSEFSGPDGTKTTFYTNSNGENLNVSNNRYFQYLAFFATRDLDYSPELDNVTVDYTLPDTAPTFSSALNTSGNFEQNQNFTASINITDETLLSGYIFGTNASGSWVNRSYLTAVTDINASFQANITFPSGSHVGWIYYANDSSNNKAQSENYYLIVNANSTLNNAPTFRSILNTSAEFRQLQNFTANAFIEDDNLLKSWTFGTNASGVWVNRTFINSSVSFNASVKTNISVSAGTLVGWVFYANDSAGNRNQTEEFWFEVVVNETANNAPIVALTGPANGSTDADGSITFSCNATDDFQLSNLTLYWNYSGIWEADSIVGIKGTSNQTMFEKTSLNPGKILWNCQACDNASQCHFASANWTVQVIPSAVINSTAINPYAVINGSQVKLFVSASNAEIVWANIVKPDAQRESMILTNNANTTFSNTSLIGTYNVTFSANNSANEIITFEDYFESFTPITFNANVVYSNLTGVRSSFTGYYRNGTLAYNSSETGNYSLELVDKTIDLEFKAYDDRIQVLLKEVNVSANNNQQLGIDKLATAASGYLATYGISNNYMFANVTLKIYYDDLSFSDENYLTLYKCKDWNFTAQTCLSNWIDQTSNTSQNTALDYFSYLTTEFSGFSIKDSYSAPSLPSGGGGGGGEKGRMTVTPVSSKEVSMVTPKVTPTRALFDLASELIKPEIILGESLVAKIALVNLGVPGKINVTLDYTISDLENNLILTEQEVITVETQIEFIKTFALPLDLKLGEYKVVVKLAYPGQKEDAISQNLFLVKPKVEKEPVPFISLQIGIIIMGILIIIFSLVLGRKRLKQINLKRKTKAKKRIKIIKMRETVSPRPKERGLKGTVSKPRIFRMQRNPKISCTRNAKHFFVQKCHALKGGVLNPDIFCTKKIKRTEKEEEVKSSVLKTKKFKKVAKGFKENYAGSSILSGKSTDYGQHKGGKKREKNRMVRVSAPVALPPMVVPTTLPLVIEPKIPPEKSLGSLTTNLIKPEIISGEKLAAKITLVNLGVPGKINVTLSYTISDLENNLVLIEQEVIAVKVQTKFIKTFALPSDLKLGRYKLVSKLIFPSQKEEVVSANLFQVRLLETEKINLPKFRQNHKFRKIKTKKLRTEKE